MDVSKFALDRSSYLSSAAAASSLYDTSKAAQASAYSAYLDPTTVLTKAYFDSKMYQESRANYAFDISKIYGTQSQQSQMSHHHQQSHILNGLGVPSNLNNNNNPSATNNNLDDRVGSPSQMDVDVKTQLTPSNEGQMDYSGYSQYSSSAINATSGSAVNLGGSAGGTSNSAGDFRRPLTVIF